MKEGVWLLAVLMLTLRAGLAEAGDAWWLFLAGPIEARYLADLEANGARIRTASRWLRAVSVEIDPMALERVRALPFVRATRPVARFERRWVDDGAASAPRLDAGEGERQRREIQADALHDLGLFGEGVRVGVLDTGFRLTHRAFARVRIGGARDFVHGDAVVADEPGQDDPGEEAHGTQTLSILAANSPGRFVGIAPLSEYFLAKTEVVTRNGRFFESKIEEDYWVAGLEWATENGCRIVNSSLGYGLNVRFTDLDGRTTIVSRAVEEAARRGTLVVNAAGNTDGARPEGNSLRGRISPPADAEHALAVGAVNPDGTIWRFSAQGPTADGRIKPDVVAPGVAVTVVSVADDVSLTHARGTSVSSPLVAGVAALLVEAFPQATPEALIEALRATASRADAPDTQYGYGIVNARAAYAYLAQRLQPTAVQSRGRPHPASLGGIKRQAIEGTLGSPYPNPARRPMAIPLLLREPTPVRLVVYDMRGRVISTLVDAVLGRGRYTVRWDGRTTGGDSATPGLYVVSLVTGRGVVARRFMWEGR